MDTVVLILIAVVIVILTVLFFLNKSKNEKPAENNQNARAVPGNLANRNLNPNLPRNLQRNRLRNRNRVNRNDDDREFDDDENANEANVPNIPEDLQGSEQEEEDREQTRKKIGTKKLAKLEEKAARREQNEQMARDREERKAREEQIYLERKKREEEEERLEKEKELAEKKAKEEQEKREYEEYLKMKELFSVDEVGEDAPHGDLDSENLLNEFVNFIKNSKIVVLEDLAAEFKLKTQDAINRINQVQEMGLLTGVMDDRGKYIYLSEEELLNVKKFIEQRGRINIMELAKASGDLINLKPVVKQNIEVEA